ncbi:vitamin K epoxide reductase complex subunit 1-like [Styela clava]
MMASKSTKQAGFWVVVSGLFLSLSGLTLSIYANYVSKAKQSSTDYEAFCDISESISCSKIFTSEYGAGFGFLHHIVGKDSPLNISNSIFGILFYSLQIVGIFQNNRLLNKILLWLSVVTVLMCIYLGYVLAYILHDFCVVCVTTYVINFCLLILNSYQNQQYNHQRPRKERRKID